MNQTATAVRLFSPKINRLLGVFAIGGVIANALLGLNAPPDQNQGVLVRLMFIHVASAWLSYLAYFGTGFFGLLYLWKKNLRFDRMAMASAELGVLFTISTLLGGMLWAKPTWGAYWVWDGRLTTTALSVLIYGGYLLLRSSIDDREKRARAAAVVGLMGTLYVPVNYMAVEWWRGVHQTQTLKLLGSPDFAASPIYGYLLLAAVVAFSLLYVYLLRVRTDLAELAEAREAREWQEDEA